jgi:hypothetical protein
LVQLFAERSDPANLPSEIDVIPTGEWAQTRANGTSVSDSGKRFGGAIYSDETPMGVGVT